jgi:hypothetical protein
LLVCVVKYNSGDVVVVVEGLSPLNSSPFIASRLTMV